MIETSPVPATSPAGLIEESVREDLVVDDQSATAQDHVADVDEDAAGQLAVIDLDGVEGGRPEKGNRVEGDACVFQDEAGTGYVGIERSRTVAVDGGVVERCVAVDEDVADAGDLAVLHDQVRQGGGAVEFEDGPIAGRHQRGGAVEIRDAQRAAVERDVALGVEEAAEDVQALAAIDEEVQSDQLRAVHGVVEAREREARLGRVEGAAGADDIAGPVPVEGDEAAGAGNRRS